MFFLSENEITSTWKTIDTPLVTVRCTTYNHVNYLRDALDGFLIQRTSFPFEIIVHDDASTDGTSDIIEEYAAQYPHIMIPIIQAENQHSKHNDGIKKTINPRIRGKYIALCEGDDYWIDPNKLERQISYMENHPDCTMTIHAVHYEQNGVIIKDDIISNYERDISTSKIIEGGGMFCATASICCLSSVYLQYPKWRTMAAVGDYPLQILNAISGKVHYFPEIMGVYRYMAKGSWTEAQKNISLANRTKINEIAWLEEFNKSTGNVYSNQVQYRIGEFSRDLYKTGEFGFMQAAKNISKMNWRKAKIKFYLSLIKNSYTNISLRKQKNHTEA